MQRTLVLVKPDGVQRGLVGEVIGRLERRGLKIVGMKMIHMNESLAKRHYSAHQGKPFFKGLVAFICSSPIVAAVFEGNNAVEAVRATMGATNCLKSEPGTIRGDLGLDVEHNLVHGSDSEESAKEEIKLFFSEDELLSYERGIDLWITAS